MVEEQEETKEKRINFFSIEVILPLLILLFMIIFRGRLGVFSFDIAQSVFFGITGLAVLAILSLDELKHRTRKVILPTGYTTFNGDFLMNECSNHGIIRAGSVRALGVEIEEFDEGSIIFPLDELQKTGRCAILNTDTVKKVELDEINDLIVTGWLMRNNISPPYYLLKSEKKNELRKPNTKRLLDILRSKTKENDLLDKEIDKKFGVAEKSVAAGSRIRDIASSEALEKLESIEKRIKELSE